MTVGDRARHNVASLRRAFDLLEKQALERLADGKEYSFHGRLELTLFIRDDVITSCETNTRYHQPLLE